MKWTVVQNNVRQAYLHNVLQSECLDFRVCDTVEFVAQEFNKFKKRVQTICNKYSEIYIWMRSACALGCIVTLFIEVQTYSHLINRRTKLVIEKVNMVIAVNMRVSNNY